MEASLRRWCGEDHLHHKEQCNDIKVLDVSALSETSYEIGAISTLGARATLASSVEQCLDRR